MVATIVGGVAFLLAAGWYFFLKPSTTAIETSVKAVETAVANTVTADEKAVVNAAATVESDVKKI